MSDGDRKRRVSLASNDCVCVYEARAGFSQQQWLLLVLSLVLGIVTVLTLDKAGLTPHNHATFTGTVHAKTTPLYEAASDE